MRRDMSKVIVERPRYGSHWKTWRRQGRYDPRRIDLDDEGEDDRSLGRAGYFRATRSSRHAKYLNENLAPLRRYLFKQAGRPWNAVWSEICEHLRPTSTVQQHVRDHIEDFVAVRTFMKDGAIWFSRRGYSPCPLDNPKWSHVQAYVDPVTGVLHLNPHYERFNHRQRRERATQLAERATRLRDLPDKSKKLVLLDDGQWWEVTLVKVGDPWGYAGPKPILPVDVVSSAGLSKRSRLDRYGSEFLFATAKRPLSRRELKQHGLTNPGRPDV